MRPHQFAILNNAVPGDTIVIHNQRETRGYASYPTRIYSLAVVDIRRPSPEALPTQVLVCHVRGRGGHPNPANSLAWRDNDNG